MVIDSSTTTELREVDVTTFVLHVSSEELRELCAALLWTEPVDAEGDRKPDYLYLDILGQIDTHGIGTDADGRGWADLRVAGRS